MSVKKVEDLVEGDLVDLEDDPYARTCSVGDRCEDHAAHDEYEIADRFEYAQVAGIERETSNCVRVDFEGRASIGFPLGHELTLNA